MRALTSINHVHGTPRFISVRNRMSIRQGSALAFRHKETLIWNEMALGLLGIGAIYEVVEDVESIGSDFRIRSSRCRIFQKRIKNWGLLNWLLASEEISRTPSLSSAKDARRTTDCSFWAHLQRELLVKDWQNNLQGKASRLLENGVNVPKILEVGFSKVNRLEVER